MVNILKILYNNIYEGDSMFLLSIGIFDITFGNIFTFVFGIAIGIAIMTIIYLQKILARIKSDGFNELSKVTIDEYEIAFNVKDKDKVSELKDSSNAYKVYQTINMYENLFYDKKLRGSRGYVLYTYDLVTALVRNIASIYSPDARFPLYEVTIDELLDLMKYLSRRISEILDYNDITYLRKINLNTIISLRNLSFDIKNSKVVQVSKKYHINNILSGFKILLNIVNPLYWVRKFVVNKSFDIVEKRICASVIRIVGGEAFNIYSKNIVKGVELIEK